MIPPGQPRPRGEVLVVIFLAAALGTSCQSSSLLTLGGLFGSNQAPIDPNSPQFHTGGVVFANPTTSADHTGGVVFAHTGGVVFANSGQGSDGTIATLDGQVSGPSELVADLGPTVPGVVRQVQTAMAPLKGAIVYLTTPAEHFYVDSEGQTLFAVTDQDGRYRFDAVPVDVPVVVTAALPKNRRLAGFMEPEKGANSLDIDLGTTMVTEFLRDHARLARTTMQGFPNLARELPHLVRLTRQLVADSVSGASSALGLDAQVDLGIHAIPQLRNAYVRAFGATDRPLSEAWKRLLGYRPLLLDEVDVGLTPDLQPLALTTSGDTTYVVAINSADLVLTESRGGQSRVLVRAARARGIQYVGGMTLAGDLLYLGSPDYGQIAFTPGTAIANVLVDRLSLERGASVVQANGSAELGNGVTAFDVAVAKPFVYISSPGTGQIIRYTIGASGLAQGPEVVAGRPNPTRLPPGPVPNGPVGGSEASFILPTSLTYREEDSKPFMYIADTGQHRIRRVDLSSAGFETVTVLGRGDEIYGNVLRPPGLREDGKLPGAGIDFPDIDDPRGVPRAEAFLAFPHEVAFDGQGRMLVADTDHFRVRLLNGERVFTVAGVGPGGKGGVGDSRRIGMGQVNGLAFDGTGNLLIAEAKSHRLRRLRLEFGW